MVEARQDSVKFMRNSLHEKVPTRTPPKKRDPVGSLDGILGEPGERKSPVGEQANIQNKGRQTSRSDHRRAGIKIDAVNVTGFRALDNVCMSLEPGTTVLVGENNTGKSAFLEALATAMGERQPVLDDLRIDPQGNQLKDFTVDILLVPTNGDSFSNEMTPLFGNAVRREGSREFIAIRTICSIGADRSTLERRRCFIEGWYGCHTPSGAKITEVTEERLTDRHLSLISFTLLHANRDLVTEMRRISSRWGRLLAQRDLPPDTLTRVENYLSEVSEHIVSNSPLLSRLCDRLNDVQEAIPTVGELELQPIPGRLDDLTKATDILVASPGGPTLPLRMQGLGSRSLAEMMVYQAFAAELPGLAEPFSPHILSCFEEPEANLHPQAQLAVMRLIDQMPGQRIVTTHSPQIASEADPKQIRLLRSSNASITVSQPMNLNQEEMISLRRLAERPHGQVLFSRLVIIGDGASERAALPVFARQHWGTNPEGKGVTFVDPLSLGQSPLLIALLEELGIPWLVFADGDQGGRDALKAIGRRIGRRVTKRSNEVVMLPEGQRYLISQGLQPAIEEAIARQYGRAALSTFRQSAVDRNLDQDELVLKFLEIKKGTYGASIAEAIVEALHQKGQPMPDRIAELLRRADHILGLDS